MKTTEYTARCGHRETVEVKGGVQHMLDLLRAWRHQPCSACQMQGVRAEDLPPAGSYYSLVRS